MNSYTLPQDETNAVLQKAMSKLTPEELNLLANFFTHASTESNSKCRKSFSPQEDEKLKQLVEKYGTSNWAMIEREMPGRNVRQCRERYKHYLSPEVSQRKWSKEEDELLLQKVSEIGSKWVRIAKLFNNRTDINVKNRWVVLMRRNASVSVEDNAMPKRTVEDIKEKNLVDEQSVIAKNEPVPFTYIPPLKVNLEQNPKEAPQILLVRQQQPF